MAGSDTLILHHYDTSPFSEKVRVMFGMARASWASVIQPTIMPKPHLTPLTGGYRRAPVMQIGADIFCDSQVILAELARRFPAAASPAGPGFAVNLWADRIWFGATVAIIFAEIGESVPRAFIEDREKLSGRPFDMGAMKAAGPMMRQQWRASAQWIEQALDGRDFLCGAAPGLADIAAYMNVWWLGGASPGQFDALCKGMVRLAAWRARLRAIGHGTRAELSPEAALEVARTAAPAVTVSHDADDPLGLAPGAPVVVMADDYGRDPIAGALVAANADRIVIARETPDLARLHVHFPRIGYVAMAA